MNGKKSAAISIFILICVATAVFAWSVRQYIESPWRDYLLWSAAIIIIVYFILDLRVFILFMRTAQYEGASRRRNDIAESLVLLNEDNDGVRAWDLRNQTGMVIGRSHDESDVDIDLSETEYFSLISSQHAVLNYTNMGWVLSDAGSKNGTTLQRAGSGQKLLLAPGEPVPIRPGDTIYIAEETVLAVV